MIEVSCNIKCWIIIIISLFSFNHVSFAQENWGVTVDELSYLGIKYEKSELMVEVAGSDCFESNYLLLNMMQCGGNQLQSKDGRFLAFNMIGSLFYKDNKQMVMLPFSTQLKNSHLNHTSESQYLRYAKKDLNLLLKMDASEEVNKKINYYTPKLTKGKFNADTAIYYTAKLKPDYYYKEKYRNLWVLVRQKDNGVIVRSYCLYEDNIPAEELTKYKEAIENAFKYDDTIRKSKKQVIDPNELKKMDLVYKIPELFYPNYSAECFKENPKLNRMFTCLGNQLHSKDKRFIVFFPAKVEAMDQKFIDRMNKTFPGKKPIVSNNQHVFQLKNEIRSAYGDEAAKHWKSYVNYYSREESKRKFNADTVNSYNIRLNPEEYYKKTYGNIWTLTLQKNNIGYISIHCLYKDMPKEELAKYKIAVEDLFRYE